MLLSSIFKRIRNVFCCTDQRPSGWIYLENFFFYSTIIIQFLVHKGRHSHQPCLWLRLFILLSVENIKQFPSWIKIIQTGLRRENRSACDEEKQAAAAYFSGVIEVHHRLKYLSSYWINYHEMLCRHPQACMKPSILTVYFQVEAYTLVRDKSPDWKTKQKQLSSQVFDLQNDLHVCVFRLIGTDTNFQF